MAIIAFIIILGLLVFVHELGHFLVAKKIGARVEEFGFGFPPRLFSVKKGGTIYSLNFIPLGGFVKILGEDGEQKKNLDSFASKKIWQRALVLLAGVAMNILLTVVLMGFGYMVGLPSAISDDLRVANADVQITQVAPNSPADLAGIKTGDRVIKIVGNGQELNQIEKVAPVQNFIAANNGREIVIFLQRGDDPLAIKIVPRVNPPIGEGALGVALARVTLQSYPWHRAIYEGFATTFSLIWLIISSIGYLIWQFFSTGHGAGQVMGPVGIFSITGQAAQMGFIYLLQLTALLSVNLAIINALPLPALDGGRILFLIIEKIKGSPVSQTVEKAIHTAGFTFLILLMVVITLKDIARLF